MRRPETSEYSSYYQSYIDLTRGVDFLQNLQDSGDQLIHFLENLETDRWDYAYQEGKWTVKQVIQHIIDCDIVFLYRALTIVRGDTETSLPGFDQDLFAHSSKLDHIDGRGIIENFRNLRSLIISMFKSFDSEKMDLSGTANNNSLTPLSTAFIIAGHTFHHLSVLKERY